MSLFVTSDGETDDFNWLLFVYSWTPINEEKKKKEKADQGKKTIMMSEILVQKDFWLLLSDGCDWRCQLAIVCALLNSTLL